MQRILSIALVAALPLLAGAQVGKTYPPLQGETLEGETVELPSAASGKKTLIGMAWSRKSEDALKGWYQPLYDKFVLKLGIFDSEYDVNLWFVPMYIGLKQTAYEGTMKELKESNRKDLFPYILFYKGEFEPYGSALRLEDKNLPYFFVLDESGKVIYATSGVFTEEKLEKIEEALD